MDSLYKMSKNTAAQRNTPALYGSRGMVKAFGSFPADKSIDAHRA